MELNTVVNAPVRVGVVGCGVVAGYGHIPAIHAQADAKLVAFADPDEARRQEQGTKYGLPSFASFEEMIANVELDAVAIPTQPAIKLDMVRIAAANGLHAFCEKPLTDTVEQAAELMRLMDEAGLLVGMAFIYRGKPVVQRMMELLREGAIGELRAVHIENLWDYHGLRDAAVRGERRRRALKNLGTLDCGVHDLDMVRYMTGADYESIAADGIIVEEENEFPDHIVMHARMTNGVLATVEESAVWGHTAAETPRYCQSYRMLGEKGYLHAAVQFYAHDATLRVVSGEKQWEETQSSAKAWEQTYRQFFDMILGREVDHRFVADGHDGLANMKVAREVIAQCRGNVGARA
jgi:predicted dehydrogenase